MLKIKGLKKGMLMSFSRVLAIDGPSGSGKSTIAKLIAEALNIVYVDTGAMFRALGLVCQAQNIAFEEGASLTKFLSTVKLKYATSTDNLVEVNGKNLTEDIRMHHVSDLASLVSKLPSVRTFLLDFQRDLAKENTCVMEGRDIGTVVFPDAFCKIYLTAKVEERAKRRFGQLKKKGTLKFSLDEILTDVKERDERDSSREFAPLKMADDAILVDSSNSTVEEVIEHISSIVQKRAQDLGFKL
jgi:cytidylate kinase